MKENMWWHIQYVTALGKTDYAYLTPVSLGKLIIQYFYIKKSQFNAFQLVSPYGVYKNITFVIWRLHVIAGDSRRTSDVVLKITIAKNAFTIKKTSVKNMPENDR